MIARAGERELEHVGPRHAAGGDAAQHDGGDVERPSARIVSAKATRW